MGCSTKTVQRLLVRTGGLPPRKRVRSALRLTLAEREEISRGLRAGDSMRTIATRLGRAPSTISREVAANCSRSGYRAWRADRQAIRKACRPKVAKLARLPRLRAEVERRLAQRWSPEQISTRLKLDHPFDPEMHVSHETIYRSLFVQTRGALRKDLTAYLRSGRTQRRPRRRPNGSGRLRNMVSISERPPEAADRAVPGHWEGDLIVGKGGHSAIGSVVERHSRYLLLLHLPDGRGAPDVRRALSERMSTLPDQLRRTLTWDQGKEMAEHVNFSIETGIPVYFCDPRSPWQRATSENTNGLLRQYFPKGTDLSSHSCEELDAVARELNARPVLHARGVCVLRWVFTRRTCGQGARSTEAPGSAYCPLYCEKYNCTMPSLVYSQARPSASNEKGRFPSFGGDLKAIVTPSDLLPIRLTVTQAGDQMAGAPKHLFIGRAFMILSASATLLFFFSGAAAQQDAILASSVSGLEALPEATLLLRLSLTLNAGYTAPPFVIG